MGEKFTRVKWATNTNIYEVNLRQYTAAGTFAAFERELPRLADMGIEVLWFMPITPISKKGRQGTLGSYYACSDYLSTNPEYGTVADFKHLVNTAHASGFKILIDWVANHTGCDHVWTKEHPDFYKRNDAGRFYDANNWVDVIDLNYENETLRKVMVDAMEFWVNTCDIDGFRCDMAHLIPLEFWAEARKRLDKLKPLFWLAETEEVKYHEVFDATYAWEFLHKMEALYKGETSLQGLQQLLEKYETTFPADALRLFFTTNHDENSHSGSEYERLGNGAKAFAVLCATWQNAIPLIYSGQELPNTKRLKFFDKDTIDWNGQYLLEDFYKTLLQLRRKNSAMQNEENVVVRKLKSTNGEQIFAFMRIAENDKVLVILNLSPMAKLSFKTLDEEVKGAYRSIFSGLEIAISGETSFEMQPWEFFVYEGI